MTLLRSISLAKARLVVLMLDLTWVAKRLRTTYLTKTMSAEYSLLLDASTEDATQSCERLLRSISDSKSIAERALATDVTTEDLRQALQDILLRLSQTINISI